MKSELTSKDEKELKEYINGQINYYNDTKIITKVDELKSEISSTKDIIVENLDKLLESEGRIQEIADKA